MPLVDSTPELVRTTYERMDRALARVRERTRRPLTLTDKLLLAHVDDPEHQAIVPGESYLLLRPDRVVLPDAIGQVAMLQFAQTGLDRIRVPATIHCDHLTEARANGPADLAASLSQNREVYEFLQSAAAKFGAGFWAAGAGIAHQVVLENYAFPGALILGTDSHTPNAGGVGACAVAVGGAEAAEVLAGLAWEVRYPRRIAIYLTGELSGWASAKDVILWLAGQLSVSGATNAVLEYIGPGARTISATGKATITNMGAELGATTSIFPMGEEIARYLKVTKRGALAALAEEFAHLLTADDGVEARPAEYFDRVIELDLSQLEPHVTGPHSPDRTRPISALARECAGTEPPFPVQLSAALIGSCTNSSYEDMSRAAHVAEQALARGVGSAVEFLITPGSEMIRATLERDGQLESLQRIGGTVLANACGPCIGQWKRDPAVAATPNTIVTSYNRNYTGRNDGHMTTQHFIASPEIVTAFALAGRISFNPLTDPLTDANGAPFVLSPPPRSSAVPVESFADAASFYTPPPEDGSGIALAVSPASERLQLIPPWAPWKDGDFSNLVLLVKAKGKTTTDQISPAGRWLRYRGHIGKSTDGLMLGVVNAHSGERGTATNARTGESAQPLPRVAQDYQQNGIKWIIVGDENYGEGSSREHAAIMPRYLGCAAVIARSFARIHESNLKKQGLLPLTFKDPADYDRIREGDRISLPDVSSIAPGREVQCSLTHADGTRESILLAHSLSPNHIRWLRAGSALNALRSAEEPCAAGQNR